MTVETSERQRAHFNAIAERYHDARTGGNHLVLRNLIWATFLSVQHLPDRTTLRVLEPMCGYADGLDILQTILGRKIEYVGFDYSDRIVADVKRARPGLELFQADVTTYQPAVDSADVVILIGGLHHVPAQAPAVVASMARALAAGGCLINFEPTNGNRLFGKIRERVYARNDLFEAATERAFPLAEYFEMFERAGLERVDTLYPGLLAYVLYYNPDAFPALNVGGPGLVRTLFNLERPFMRSRLAATFSFATLSMWRKPTAQPSVRRNL